MSTKDRLDELRQMAGAVRPGGADNARADTEAPRLPADVAELLQEVEAINKWINEVNGDTQLIRRLHSDPTYHTNRHVQEQLDAAVTRTHAAGLKLCGALRQLEARARDRRPGDGGSAGGRMARLHYAVARRRYADALAEHARLLQLLRDDRARLLHEQVKLTNLTISEEECEQLLDSNNVALFVDNVRAETAEARRLLREAEVRRDELARVEGALQEVRDLFLQLSHLVAQQQEQIDSVEYFAMQATEHVESGGQQLLQGTVSRRKATKKKLGLAVCLASGFLVVLLVLIYT
ncbi:syntaxin-1A-like [Battus philenor]|uniref:syntaxin-1A-like n=1 Tax=Battus philenor TaxID=42288 RepID=UPI0035D09CF7